MPNRAEQGASVPAIDMLERLASGLGVDPAWLAFGPEGEEPYRVRRPREIHPQPMPQPTGARASFHGRHRGCAGRIRDARERRHLSMSEAAAAAGITQQTWSNTEAGKTVPRVDNLERMAVALDVAPAWLAYGYEEEATASAATSHGLKAATEPVRLAR